MAARKRKKLPAHRLLESEADVAQGAAALARQCAIMRHVHKKAGVPPLRRTPAGFVGLCRIVVFQQVSTASGNAIWARVEAGIKPFAPAKLLRLSDEQMRALGLSRPKVRTLRAVADAVADGRLDLDALAAAPEEEVRETLIALHGIGPWTADIYLMFSLGRADTFAAGDLALQEAARIAMKLEQRPSAVELARIAERWRPWRAVAAQLLWAYYRVAKETKGGQPV